MWKEGSLSGECVYDNSTSSITEQSLRSLIQSDSYSIDMYVKVLRDRRIFKFFIHQERGSEYWPKKSAKTGLLLSGRAPRLQQKVQGVISSRKYAPAYRTPESL